MLWYTVLVWVGAQIVFKALKIKRDKVIRTREQKRRRREFKALYRAS